MKTIFCVIGSEPDHRVVINLDHVVYIQAKGGFTYVYLTNGDKLLVDDSFHVFKDKLEEEDKP